jgi:glycosyltransferase involved in cell wall biosynthesis
MKSHEKASEVITINGDKQAELYSVKDTITKKITPAVSSSVNKIKNIICFSHLRWDFVFQRPQHLLSRWVAEANVFYVEEPIFDSAVNKLKTSKSKEGVNVVVPHVKEGLTEAEINKFLEEALPKFIKANDITNYMFWYLTPMALPFSHKLDPVIVVYDCMDELSCFKGAHPDLLPNESALLRYADVVFTGGHHLYEYKKSRHNNIHPFPSSIDRKHFESGKGCADPEDQKNIPHPRVGFFGVIDERLDIQLLDGLAKAMPDVHFVMLGPVVKINPANLPQYQNIHYLGQKSYQDLPKYLANWDVAFLPFAKNESTRFISPTKTPEYLCAGIPVVSTSIRDVVMPYGEEGLVFIADSVPDFAAAIYQAQLQKEDAKWQKKVKNMLKRSSWDLTWEGMKKQIITTLEKKEAVKKELIPMHNQLLKTNASGVPLNRMV